MKHIFNITILTFLLSSTEIFATDTIIKLIKHNPDDLPKHVYGEKVLNLALEKTIKKYGDYKVVRNEHKSRNRILFDLQTDNINAYITSTKTQWEETTIPIYIPVTKGLLGYHLLLINKEKQTKFDNLQNKNDLKRLNAGFGADPSMTEILKELNYKVLENNDRNDLYFMLNENRIDYFIHGLNIFFKEYNHLKNELRNIVVDREIALYIPTPIYIFVSPKKAMLAKRIYEGLEMAIEDGSFDKLFLEYHKTKIEKADLKSRKIFHIENPFLIHNENSYIKKYWFTP